VGCCLGLHGVERFAIVMEPGGLENHEGL
jgi:hypothetical protein